MRNAVDDVLDVWLLDVDHPEGGEVGAAVLEVLKVHRVRI